MATKLINTSPGIRTKTLVCNLDAKRIPISQICATGHVEYKFRAEDIPIIVYPYSRWYFVIDGNHRLADHIHKRKIEIRAWVLPPDPTGVEFEYNDAKPPIISFYVANDPDALVQRLFSSHLACLKVTQPTPAKLMYRYRGASYIA